MINNVNVVIFHSPCFDGSAGAWVVKHWCKQNKRVSPVFFGAKPGRKEYDFPDLKGKSVVVIDICFDRDIIKQMRKDAKEFVVLDHHKSSEENMKGLDYAIFDMNRSGCQMAWDYFFPGEDRPKFINHIADRDIWTWTDALSRPFTTALFNRYGFLSQEETCDAIETISKFTDEEYNNFVQYGINIQDFENKQVESALKCAVLCDVHLPNGTTVRAWTSDSRLHRSEIGSRLSKREDAKFALMYGYDLKSNEWWISLRSDNNAENVFSVSDIAKMFPKGGGHTCAAGFTWYKHISDLLSVVENIV